MDKIDFHIHTNASDGSWNCQEVIYAALENDVKYLAVTDHDSVSNVKLCEYLAKQNGINYIRATEICSKSFDKEIHILGYDIDIDDAKLNMLLAKTRYIRENRDLKIVEYVHEHIDSSVTLEEYNVYKRIEQPGLEIMNYLAEKDVCTEILDFNNIKEKVPLDDSEDLVDSKEVIKTIKEAGGRAVLAHPSYYFPNDYMPKHMLDSYLEWGIEGIECYSTYNPLKRQNEYYYDYCKKYDLIVSGGSDCHGSVYKTRFIGTPETHLSQTNLLSRCDNYKHLQNNPCF